MKPTRIAFLAAILQLPAHAAISYVDTSPIRALTNSETNEWDVFAEGFAVPNSPDVSSAGSASLTQTTPGAILTGGGNIYSFGAATTYELSYAGSFVDPPNDTYIGNVVLQLSTFGTILDYSSMTLTYTNSLAQTFVADPFGFQNNPSGEPFTPPGGVPQEISTEDLIAYQWNLTGLDAVSFSIGFASSGPHMSLDQVTLDTASTGSLFQAIVTPVPEPRTALLLTMATAGLFLRRRKPGTH